MSSGLVISALVPRIRTCGINAQAVQRDFQLGELRLACHAPMVSSQATRPVLALELRRSRTASISSRSSVFLASWPSFRTQALLSLIRL